VVRILFAQSVGPVGDHDRGDVEPVDAEGVPEGEARQERGLLLEGQLVQQLCDVETISHARRVYRVCTAYGRPNADMARSAPQSPVRSRPRTPSRSVTIRTRSGSPSRISTRATTASSAGVPSRASSTPR